MGAPSNFSLIADCIHNSTDDTYVIALSYYLTSGCFGNPLYDFKFPIDSACANNFFDDDSISLYKNSTYQHFKCMKSDTPWDDGFDGVLSLYSDETCDYSLDDNNIGAYSKYYLDECIPQIGDMSMIYTSCSGIDYLYSCTIYILLHILIYHIQMVQRME
jgi:hypothetical protein